jgi:hypothetical protein
MTFGYRRSAVRFGAQQGRGFDGLAVSVLCQGGQLARRMARGLVTGAANSGLLSATVVARGVALGCVLVVSVVAVDYV